MSDQPHTKSVVIERELPFPAERVWRALTEPHLMAEWLMTTDFVAEEGADFGFSSPYVDIACQVVTIRPLEELSYTWEAHGLDSVVTWTLRPTERGVLLRMEQSGFRADQGRAYGGARQGWGRFLDNLEQVLDRTAS